MKVESFAASKGWTLRTVYADDAISGSELNRPGLECLLHEVSHSSEVGVVLARYRNRLARPKDPIDGLMLECKL